MSVNLGNEMKFFSKKETGWILVILVLIASASLYNFRLSLRRARDAQRKADLGQIYNGLGEYHADFGFYPPSLDGKIVACEKPGIDISKMDKKEVDLMDIFQPCEWGQDSLGDVFDPSYPAYLEVLPVDPHKTEGASYIYFSSGSHFQLYASLEGEDEEEFQSVITERNLACGVRVCNFGRASGVTPLDKSIKEYENELLQKNER